MKRPGDIPPDPKVALIDGGADALREAIPILTKAQAQKLFRSAYMAAIHAEMDALKAAADWLDDYERRNRAREAAERLRAERETSSKRDRNGSAGAQPPPMPAHIVLGVQPGAKRTDIQAAWRKLANRWHPDRPEGDAAIMANINAARDQLLRQVSA